MCAGIFIGDYTKNNALKEHLQSEHEPDGVTENEVYKILWNFTIQCDIKIEVRRPDIVLIDKTKKEVKVLDVIVPGNKR